VDIDLVFYTDDAGQQAFTPKYFRAPEQWHLALTGMTNGAGSPRDVTSETPSIEQGLRWLACRSPAANSTLTALVTDRTRPARCRGDRVMDGRRDAYFERV
jgi:hypothetical protein